MATTTGRICVAVQAGCQDCDNVSPMATVVISNRGAKRIRKGHLWVYRSDVRESPDAEAGAIVTVLDEAGNSVGQAFHSADELHPAIS